MIGKMALTEVTNDDQHLKQKANHVRSESNNAHNSLFTTIYTILFTFISQYSIYHHIIVVITFCSIFFIVKIEFCSIP